MKLKDIPLKPLEVPDPTGEAMYDPIFLKFGQCYYTCEHLLANHHTAEGQIKKLRHYLAHNFWWENEEVLTGREEVHKALQELDDIKGKLDRIPVVATRVAGQGENPTIAQKYFPVFLEFGKCYYKTEYFRTVLCTLLAWYENPSGMTPRTDASVHKDIIDDLLAGEFETVISGLKKHLDGKAVEDLESIVHLRHHLAHDFWPRHETVLSGEQDMSFVLQVLDDMKYMLGFYSFVATRLLQQREEEMGVSQGIAATELMLDSGCLLVAPSLTRKERRDAEKMRRTPQRLLRVWEHHILGRFSWYFEFADNFVWRISERQLNPLGFLPHDQMRANGWIPAKAMEPYLPADICLTPEESNVYGALDYEIPLSSKVSLRFKHRPDHHSAVECFFRFY